LAPNKGREFLIFFGDVDHPAQQKATPVFLNTISHIFKFYSMQDDIVGLNCRNFHALIRCGMEKYILEIQGIFQRRTERFIVTAAGGSGAPREGFPESH